MARPHGFDHFCSYLKGLENQYVIIGGGAASILLDDDGLEFRATKDVDLVVLSRSDELNKRILAYIELGKYKTKEITDKKPRYYRFQAPENPEAPKMIELFARNEIGLELGGDQHIIPIKNDSAEKLSAILLDDEYFELIQKNLIASESGIPLVNAVANICLKARAHRELLDRKNSGDTSIDERDIQKHLKDIWRLGILLTGGETPTLSKTPKSDVTSAIAKLEALPDAQFKKVMEKTPGTRKEDVMTVLKRVFAP